MLGCRVGLLPTSPRFLDALPRPLRILTSVNVTCNVYRKFSLLNFLSMPEFYYMM